MILKTNLTLNQTSLYH